VTYSSAAPCTLRSIRRWLVGCLSIGIGLWASLLGCGARSSLPVESSEGGGGEGGCEDGAVEACGSDVGVCVPGQRTCHGGEFGPCEGAIGPTAEVCDGLDNNCNGVTDADCEVGHCTPTLLVIGSTPSSPSCIDFPVEAGSTGMIDLPCGGGVVTATLGAISFSGSVESGVLSLDGSATLTGPDGCLWHTTHHIGGVLSSGTLSYSYHEKVMPKPGQDCWNPCTESGTVTIEWK
jgi:hypothetical protein